MNLGNLRRSLNSRGGRHCQPASPFSSMQRIRGVSGHVGKGLFSEALHWLEGSISSLSKTFTDPLGPFSGNTTIQMVERRLVGVFAMDYACIGHLHCFLYEILQRSCQDFSLTIELCFLKNVANREAGSSAVGKSHTCLSRLIERRHISATRNAIIANHFRCNSLELQWESSVLTGEYLRPLGGPCETSMVTTWQ
ncbi:hypothetical protein BDQ17DRAFT_891744 [Cyathus striatus]|nr:hypothetical protein BDQ17DRAFT_891744 [Cyathus striatus]